MTTLKDCEAICENLNRRLTNGRWIELQRRNGYLAADEYSGAGCLRMLTAGTKQEVYDALWNMIRGIDLYNAPSA